MWQRVVNFYLPDATIDPAEKMYLSRRHIKTRHHENQKEIERFFSGRKIIRHSMPLLLLKRLTDEKPTLFKEAGEPKNAAVGMSR